MKPLHIGIALFSIVAIGVFLLSPRPQTQPTSQNNAVNLKPAFAVKLPSFNAQQQAGQKLFEKNCQQCHGKSATGTGNGPPLIHRYYEPNHHTDYAFYRATQSGVKAHHWPFGNMPPIPTVKKDDVTHIISYVRAIQRENGIQ